MFFYCELFAAALSFVAVRFFTRVSSSSLFYTPSFFLFSLGCVCVSLFLFLQVGNVLSLTVDFHLIVYACLSVHVSTFDGVRRAFYAVVDWPVPTSCQTEVSIHES